MFRSRKVTVRATGRSTVRSGRSAGPRMLWRVYERLGARIVLATIAFVFVAGALTIFVTWVWMARYLDLPASDFSRFVAVSAATVALAGIIVMSEQRALFRTLVSWSEV